MKFCQYCGEELQDDPDICLKCGKIINVNPQKNKISDDQGDFGWGVLGFCVPLVGLILYIVWKDDKPMTSKIAGKGALISVIIGGILSILYLVIVFIMIAINGY